MIDNNEKIKSLMVFDIEGAKRYRWEEIGDISEN